MPTPKKSTATKKSNVTRATTPAAPAKPRTPARPRATEAPKPAAPTPAPTLDKITERDVVRLWRRGAKGCWVGMVKAVTADEVSFCVRWHKDSPPVAVKRADISKLEVKQGARYVEVVP